MGGHKEERGSSGPVAVKVAMSFHSEFCRALSQLPNKLLWSGSQCNTSFLEAQFCRVGPDQTRPQSGSCRPETDSSGIGIWTVCYPSVPPRYDSTAS